MEINAPAETKGLAAPRQGHLPTLIASFLHFDLSFMLWVSLGALGIYIAESLALSPSQKGLVVAIPILSGSLLRIPLGLLGDRIGGKRVGVAMLLFLFIPLFLGWQAGDGLPALLGVGLMLGTAGASFAVALPLASRWYPANRQGLVMGIAAAGNSGTVIANLAAPRLAAIAGWHNVLALAMIPLAVVLVVFALIARDSPERGNGVPMSHYGRILKHSDLWWLCAFYTVTFGGYVGLSSFLPIFFRDQYAVSPVKAGYLTALVAFVGSGLRPVGGYLADRFGGVRMLSLLLLSIGGAYLVAALLLPLPAMMLVLLLGMASLGMGNGAIFQLVPLRFGQEIGVVTGIVGALGGLGGFLLPMLLGNIKQASGSFGPALLILGLMALAALGVLRALTALRSGWRAPARQPAAGAQGEAA